MDDDRFAPDDPLVAGSSGPSSNVELDVAPPPARGSAEPRASEPPPLDRAAVEALGDYGAVPSSLAGVVPYALLVLTRRRALRQALGDLERVRGVAARDATEALVELGRALHAQAGDARLGPLRAELEAADRTAREAGTRTDELARTREAGGAQREALDARLAEAERAAAPFRDRETKLATQLSVRETDFRRAKARLSRVEIELRAQSLDAGKRELLAAELDARRAEVERASGQIAELTPRLAEARRELASRLAAVNALAGERRALDATEARALSLHQSTAGAAERAHDEALAALGEAALARGLAAELASERARRAKTLLDAKSARERELLLHRAALTAYDKPAFQKGAALLGAAAAAILGMLALLLLR